MPFLGIMSCIGGSNPSYCPRAFLPVSIYSQLSASCIVLFWSILPCTGGSCPACRPREFPPVSIYCSTLNTCTCRGVLGYHRLYWRIKPTLSSKSISSCDWCIYLLLNTVAEQFLGITGGTGGSRPSWCQRAFPVFTAQHHSTGTVVEQFLVSKSIFLYLLLNTIALVQW